ncbi:MAG: hypothetical protein A2249_00185 [Candidatus Jacksonbacteria bacterium RIFOXYA2_FULL_44_7]|uniref:BioF2-like acetyltransferase domain-containing protein n=1 Tax=Candidatus Jacksonbacteria bacterium RIFCSPLOWO2_02_FULL_44_20 TaxID=1798460 RepID=A0A1G2A7F3_9BACT|nr:MAG: hypothetical protein UW39_C0002G0030 [Parcubacteria group bacterium GW2011_GWC2_44_17]KKT50075.1 MAG: hypothetical protein UW40_C0010G0026 [Parcubacteria group bacterium GW2011_GWF2_44_17]OGY69500.1 MAG: hypothetical protein A3C00_00360 [Candidatus Jacksonbacteria bacterium RIFCSPHIGHO2_02_FULL_44_25]OGY71533.1 MAG: hypothetical protein A3E05_04235 [Candidatus Jacksonbacteria bacterium RIFCSPHIGHO2_12_FULL_44_12]OGY72784.1 MAG: hypothetical protein A3H61_02420 [Candidatus Jacksonbacteri
MELLPLTITDHCLWDDTLAQFESAALFHESVWLDFIEQTQKGKKYLFRLVEQGRAIGYFPAFILKKWPFAILASPANGWNTSFMGPVMEDPKRRTAPFIKTLDTFCQSQRIDHVEIASPILDASLMLEAGFSCKRGKTMLVDIDDPKIMFSRLKSEARTAIRKAKNHGLIVKESNDHAFVDRYYKQLTGVFARQKLAPTYPKERVASLFRLLKAKNQLLTLEVLYRGISIASGVFPYGEKTVYFFGGAGIDAYRNLRPHDLLHYTLMTKALELGIRHYDMEGTSAFKEKFGGYPIERLHFYKSYTTAAQTARGLYERYFKIKQKIQGSLIHR